MEKKRGGCATILVLGSVAFALSSGGVVAWRIGKALSDSEIRLLVGGCAVLAVVLVVGAMFIAWSASQSRLYRQMLEQDDFDELRKMAMILKLGSGRAPNVTVKTPDNPQLPGPMFWPYPTQQGQGQTPMIDSGEYRDSINLE